MIRTLNDQRVRYACTRFLSYHRPRSAHQWLTELMGEPDLGGPPDVYGTGGCLTDFESSIAKVLGKEAAVLMPSGVMAQQVALRIWTDLVGRPTVALHAQSHIHRDAGGGYERLHGLVGLPLTQENRYPCLDDLTHLCEPLGVLVLELPLRRVAYALPDWSALESLVGAARAAGARIHIDGARLWECCPHYQRNPADLAALSDSVYVSLYKGLGGIAGAVLAGPQAFINAARVWQHRQGGLLHSLFPLAMAASAGLRRHLPKMAGYAAQAQALACRLLPIDGLLVLPEVPQVNAFQVHFRGITRAALQAAHDTQAKSTQAWLFNWFEDSFIPSSTYGEIVIGDAYDDWSIEQAVHSIEELLCRVRNA